MCIHEQLKTLHDRMSAHMKTYKNVNVLKNYFVAQLFSSQKARPKKKKEKKETIEAFRA